MSTGCGGIGPGSGTGVPQAVARTTSQMRTVSI
jgi:hypothetical protein